MPLNPKLEAKLSKVLEPNATVQDSFSGKDLTIITDANGHAKTLFIGKRNPDGSIQGERYVRRLVLEADGKTVKSSHWEAKGKVSRE
ncbi:hypothetical protein GU926_17235 [Nibribacter ruber]|uniref:Uncharacterized protein n=1 Tax=Nibribacter ruber TaxID=2698458 RepID=A0A6P1P3R5_9BACT|nr:hypothetical protein [Nibribacter ruber]QHL89077.1 hypothetical protein GU926_17235 [Nibribacter ruber]